MHLIWTVSSLLWPLMGLIAAVRLVRLARGRSYDKVAVHSDIDLEEHELEWVSWAMFDVLAHPQCERKRAAVALFAERGLRVHVETDRRRGRLHLYLVGYVEDGPRRHIPRWSGAGTPGWWQSL